MVVNLVVLLGIAITVVTAVPVFRQMRKHPKGLHILFFAEMWERFSYYGMRALLIFYLTQHFLFSDSFSATQYGAYTALVYLLPLVGGYLADRYLGNRKAIAFGALLLVAGHLTMGIEGEPAREALVHDGERFELVADGRGSAREVRIEVDQALYTFTVEVDNQIALTGLPEAAPLEPVISQDDYEMVVEQENAGLFGVIGARSRTYYQIGGERYELIEEGVFDKTRLLLVDGEPVALENRPLSDFVVTDLPGGASLPARIEDGAYSFEIAERDRTFLNIFYLALALIVMGVGFLKANISSIVGQLYPENDPRRDGGFTLYYYGINLGSFWAAILCGLLGETVGWWAGFGLAGVGMALGWLVFIRGRLLFMLPGANLIEHVGNPPDRETLTRPVIGPINREWIIYGIGLLGVVVSWFLVQAHTVQIFGADFMLLLLLAGGVVFLGVMIWFMVNECDAEQTHRLILGIILIVASVVFWSLFEQAGSSMNLFAARNTDLTVAPVDAWSLGPLTFDLRITASQVQSFNAGFILIFAPVFAALWAFLARLQRNPNTPLKFGLALIQVGLGFMLLVWGVNFADDSFRVPLIFLAGAYLLHTTGELCLSPVGLSAITKLSPGAIVSFMMAGWFLSTAFAQYVAGAVAALTATDTVAGQVLDSGAALDGYARVFGTIGLFAIGVGVVMALASFQLKKLGHGRAEDQLPTDVTEAAGPDQDARDLV